MTTQLPDGPKLLPFFQLVKWLLNPFEYLDECAKKYGDIFTMRLFGFKPMIFISDSEAIKQIFSYNHQKISVAQSNKLILSLFGENSLLALNGSRHKKERKMLMPSFHGEKVKSYAEAICKISENVASKWQINKPFIAREAMQEITLEVIIQTVFGLSEGKRYQEIKPLLAEWTDLTSTPVRSSFIFFQFLQVDLGPWSPWGNFIRTKEKNYDLVQAEIEDRRANPALQGDDILSLMMSATDEEGQPMSDDRLKDELMTLLIAGHETTATALAWAFYWLEKLPQVREKLLQEIDSLGDNPDPIALSQLPYLTAICQETLRLYPVVPIAQSRDIKSEVELMGRKFEAGTRLTPCIYLTHHREDLYPDSFEFKPERFLERQYTNYEFIPFGGGIRLCLGYALAMLEMKLVIASVLAKYELALVDNNLPKPQRRGLTLTPNNGIPLVKTGLREAKKSVVLN